MIGSKNEGCKNDFKFRSVLMDDAIIGSGLCLGFSIFSCFFIMRSVVFFACPRRKLKDFPPFGESDVLM
jgi:hypothetical protein